MIQHTLYVFHNFLTNFTYLNCSVHYSPMSHIAPVSPTQQGCTTSPDWLGHNSLVEFCRVGSRVEPVCLTRVKCDTGETHWCNTSCLRDGAGVIRVYSHWCYTVFYTIIKLVLILVIYQEIFQFLIPILNQSRNPIHYIGFSDGILLILQ